MDLQTIRTTATDIARQAGALLLTYFDRPHQEQTKQNIYDIVTEGDKASEALIVAALREAFPDHHIVGEEGSSVGAPAQEAEFFWYIDPVDGTSNFANNIPFFAVSIALADRHMRPLVGVILDPVRDELYSAARGHGATLNGKPIRPSSTDTLERAIMATGFPYDLYENPDGPLSEWTAFILRTRGLRRFGSAALDMAYVACGRLEGFWERRLNPWDCQAGILCVLEAGGQATDYAGSTDKLFSGQEVVVSNGLLHAQMLAVLNRVHQPQT